MNAEQVEIFGTLKGRIKEVMRRLEHEKKEKEKVRSEFQNLKQQFEQLSEDYKELEQKYNTLKLARVLNGGNGEDQDAKLKVNRIVREIDKCIALLNR